MAGSFKQVIRDFYRRLLAGTPRKMALIACRLKLLVMPAVALSHGRLGAIWPSHVTSHFSWPSSWTLRISGGMSEGI